MGVLRVRGEGRNHTARLGSRGWGDVGQGRSRGSRSGTYGEAPEAPRPSPALPAGPGNGGDTHMAALGCADLALSVRSSLPGLVAPQLPLSPRPASAPPSARRPPPSHPAPPQPAGPHPLRSRGSRTRGGAHARSALSGNGAGQWPAGSTSLRGGGALEDARAVGVFSAQDPRELGSC